MNKPEGGNKKELISETDTTEAVTSMESKAKELSEIGKRKRGRPPNSKRKLPKIDAPVTAQRMYDYGKIGMNLKSMADACGVGYDSFYTFWGKNPKLRAYYLKGKGDGKEARLNLLNEKILGGSSGALYFALERIDNFSQKTNLDIQMPERPAISVSDDQQRRMAEVILSKFSGQSFEQVKGALGAGVKALTAETIDIEPLAEVKDGIAAAEHSLRGYPASKIIDGGVDKKEDRDEDSDRET